MTSSSMGKTLALALVLALGTFLSGCGSSDGGGKPPSVDPNARLAQKLKAIIDKHALFWNASMSFAIHNETIDVAVAGGRNDYSDPSSRLTINNTIPMGSTTKLYTSVSVMRLVEQGVISLDQTISPLVDKYVAVKLPCSTDPPQCKPCYSIAHCLSDPTNASCKAITPEASAACSYCLRYLHCHCDGSNCPVVPTLKMFWGNNATIEKVTFRDLLGMQSGVLDYYFDPTNWLFKTVLTTTRDVEPLEFLAHMGKQFLFQPGSGRASYSTNGFSLVGLALAGLFNLTSWADLDQHKLALGTTTYEDDSTLFPHRGPCTNYATVPHQYGSIGPNQSFVDIREHSCLNSWMGGNLAARPLDVARFVHDVFTAKLLNKTSLDAITSLHEITDGFAAHSLAYGLGLEAQWNGGQPTPLQTCKLYSYGHGGEDYASGAPLAGYFPDLKLGVTFAMTSAPLLGARPMGMNCSLRYETLARAPEMAMNELLNAVMEEVAGVPPSCDRSSWDVPDNCTDAPSIGSTGSTKWTCDAFLAKASAGWKTTEAVVCDNFLARLTLAQMQQYYKTQHHIDYVPPPGYDANTTLGVDLCRATCGAVGGGPCWMKGAYAPWCNAHDSSNISSYEQQVREPFQQVLV